MFPTDIEISRQAQLHPIDELAEQLGIPTHAVSPYGRYKGKIKPTLVQELPNPRGKLVLVSAITPTPLGEGKTVTTIGLSMGLNRIGQRTFANIRQPSLGPVFGVKGGAAGGGYAQVVPMEEMNLHLSGDFHALAAAHNLAAAALDARLFHENELGENFTAKSGLPHLNIDPEQILWPRTVDMNDRALRQITIGQGGKMDGFERKDRFVITAASELMAILALATSLDDLRQRIGRIHLARSLDGSVITAEDLEVAGAMTVLLLEALAPTLMQTTEGTPALVHAGPFANIAHGNSSIIADQIALRLADYVVTEAGFGSDMGLEKFFNIKCRTSQTAPSCVVLVATVRALKLHSGRFELMPGQALPRELSSENLELLAEGCCNLEWHINNAKRYGVPVVVAINRFPTDSQAELDYLQQRALELGAVEVAVSSAFAEGGVGAEALAEAVVRASQAPSQVELLYPNEWSLREKLEKICCDGYGASKVELSELAEQQLARYQAEGYGHLPLCMAKTPLSISSDPALKGAPRDFVVAIREVHLCAGAGFLYALAGSVMTMPGLGVRPAYRNIDIDANGQIIGLS